MSKSYLPIPAEIKPASLCDLDDFKKNKEETLLDKIKDYASLSLDDYMLALSITYSIGYTAFYFLNK